MDGANITQTRGPLFVGEAKVESWSWGRTTPSLAGIRRRAGRQARCLWRGMTARVQWSEPMSLALAAVMGLSILFLILPGIDIAVSELVYRPHEGFFLAQVPVLKALRRSSTFVMGAILLLALAGVVLRLCRHRHARHLCARRCSFLLIGLALGPGLVVNACLKNGWGRARPVQTDLFGGQAHFTPVWQMSDSCQTNCSFVSGEAASAAWMVAALVLLPPRWRVWAAVPITAYSLALSMNRLVCGGHYLSDILLSWAITGLVLTALYRFMVTPSRRVRRRSLPACRQLNVSQ